MKSLRILLRREIKRIFSGKNGLFAAVITFISGLCFIGLSLIVSTDISSIKDSSSRLILLPIFCFFVIASVFGIRAARGLAADRNEDIIYYVEKTAGSIRPYLSFLFIRIKINILTVAFIIAPGTAYFYTVSLFNFNILFYACALLFIFLILFQILGLLINSIIKDEAASIAVFLAVVLSPVFALFWFMISGLGGSVFSAVDDLTRIITEGWLSPCLFVYPAAAAILLALAAAGSISRSPCTRILSVASCLIIAVCISAPLAFFEGAFEFLHGAFQIMSSNAGHGAAKILDIVLVYFAALPLAFLVPIISLITKRKFASKKAGYAIPAIIVWSGLMLSASFLQQGFLYRLDLKISPELSEYTKKFSNIFRALNSFEVKGDKETRPAHVPQSGDPAEFLFAGGNSLYLKNFLSKLTELKNGRRDRVHVIHYGDSFLWGDCFSSTLKRSFQADFGDGGRGIVPPVPSPSTFLTDITNMTQASHFSNYVLKHNYRVNGRFIPWPVEDHNLGFTGESFYPRHRTVNLKFSAPTSSSKWTRIKVYLRGKKTQAPARVRVEISYSGGQTSRDADIFPDRITVPELNVPGIHECSISIVSPEEKPFIDAVEFNSGAGVAYSTIVRMGIHMAWLTAIPEKHLAEGLRTAEPDLVIFQFGINEAASLSAFSDFKPETYRAQLRAFLLRIKSILPQSDILLIGPPERLKSSRGGLMPYSEALVVRKIQREETLRAGVGFFDTYGFLGGAGHMERMARQGLAMNDYTHLTKKGGSMTADGVYRALYGYGKKYGEKKERLSLSMRDEQIQGISSNSPAYAIFLVFVVIVSGLLLKARLNLIRIIFFLIASYYFYSTWNWLPLAFLVLITISDYSIARLISMKKEAGKRGTGFLFLSLCLDLGILFAFKYANFFSAMAMAAGSAAGFKLAIPVLNIAVPAGISFYTFQSMSYVIDVWRGNMKPEKSLIRYAVFVSFFPQILSGPIARAKEFLPVLRDKATHFTLSDGRVSAALFLVLCGLLKKCGADWLAVNYIDRVYSGPGMFTSIEILAAVYGYGLEIYLDFSGYTDIALASAMLLGFRLPENFRRPYVSGSVSEFWTRWHISLGSWLRDYLYIGLGGNRKRVYLNILITMLLCGLWHGASITFVLWGAYHGIIMIIERITGFRDKVFKQGFMRVIKTALCFHLVLIGWVLFRSESLEKGGEIINGLIGLRLGALNLGYGIVVIIVIGYLLHFSPLKWKDNLMDKWNALSPEIHGFMSAVVTITVYYFSSVDVRPFIYFQF